MKQVGGRGALMMKVRCYFLRKRFLRYLEGGIAPHQAQRLEKHLADCRECGEFLERLRAGHEAGRQFGRLGPENGHNPPDFDELWAELGGALVRTGRPVPAGGRILRVLQTPLTAGVIITLALAASLFVVASHWNPLRRADGLAADSSVVRPLRDFTSLRIAEFSSNTKSPIVTEGLVRDVYFDDEEKTLHIKLVESQQKSEPFVICEVRRPSGMAIPREGSRVRIYGMARYDAQPGRGWNEVNPVTNIDVLKH